MEIRDVKANTRRPDAEVPMYRTKAARDGLMAIYEEKLRQWPVPHEAFLISTRYGKTHIIASGDPAAPPVVLLHPEAVAALTWAPISPELSRRYRLYAPDTIGDMGRSELANFDYYLKKPADFSAWIDDIYHELNIEKADLVGGSFGGWIAMQHAIEAPDRVGTLVLLGPMGLASWVSMLRLFGPMMSLVLHPTDASNDRMIKLAIGEGERVNRELVPWLKIAGKCTGRTAWPLRIPDARLQKIRARTLLFLGGRDEAVGNPIPVANRARRLFQRSEIELLPKAAHMMMYDEPEFISARIIRFISGGEAEGEGAVLQPPTEPSVLYSR